MKLLCEMTILSQTPSRKQWCVIEWDGIGYAKLIAGPMTKAEAQAKLEALK